MLGRFSALRKEKREVVGEGLVDPLIPVAGPADNVAPPLMGDFVIRDDVSKGFLAGGGESRAILRFGGQERKCRNVKQAGPPLAESAGNLRDAQRAIRKRPAEIFVKAN